MVSAPRGLSGLIKIKTRSRLGRYELRDKFPEILASEEKNYRGAFCQTFRDVRLWPKLLIYLTVNLMTRLRAKRQYRCGRIAWERDDSSRAAL